jgi:hypothetical protein
MKFVTYSKNFPVDEFENYTVRSTVECIFLPQKPYFFSPFPTLYIITLIPLKEKGEMK